MSKIIAAVIALTLATAMTLGTASMSFAFDGKTFIQQQTESIK